MKQKVLFFLSMITFMSVVYSQEIIGSAGSPKKFSIGFVAGIGPEWLSSNTDEYKSDGSILGYQLGVTMNFSLNEKQNYFFTTGAIYQHIGGKVKFNDIRTYGAYTDKKTDIEQTYRMGYLTIPIGLKLSTPQFGDFVINGNVGFYNSIKLNSDIKERYDNQPEKVESGYKTLFIKESLYLGLGCEYIIIDNFRAFVNVNYNFGLSNIVWNTRNTITKEKVSLKNNGIEFTVGLYF